ncbi:hypothetical protein B0J12DRAFT_398570 [Macrophomina phaseolina]|uniref:Secreted protein n=1 Tax=Macrophomina phaseolina TaxID=35725 RepID=A0ABQ8GL49_9PEZI|nr:hypothetical protein B0J12DRAFT_398570 [Macrophomina phaseolina]
MAVLIFGIFPPLSWFRLFSALFCTFSAGCGQTRIRTTFRPAILLQSGRFGVVFSSVFFFFFLCFVLGPFELCTRSSGRKIWGPLAGWRIGLLGGGEGGR